MIDYLERMIRVFLELPCEIELKCLDDQGRYWILNDGRILSVCREEPRYLHPTDNGNGYYQVKMNGKNYYIHRLLALAFNNDNITDIKQCEVHHKDLNKKNNDISNLVLISKDKHLKLHSELRKNKKSGNAK